jgi:type I restriction enzyme R subunit
MNFPKRGMIEVLRHGIVDLGVTVRLCYFKPGSGMNQTAMAQYDKNILQVTRQVKYSLANENSIDTVIFLNGLPIITMELKNPLTGQTFQNAITQYKNDRAPNEPLLKFGKRALVHFAMDTDEIWMTTKLNRQDTTFIPFNRGFDKGAGNPPIEGSYRTAYLWREILQRDSILDILHRFIQTTKDNKTGKEKLIFPRYHQLDVVRFLVNQVCVEGCGHNLSRSALCGIRKYNTYCMARPSPLANIARCK